MAQALGVKFIGANGKEITTLCSGGMLDQIAGIDMSGLDPRVRKTRIIIASDVDNPLYGRRGAAYVFGPQKGATPEMVKLLDSNLRRAAAVIKRDCGIDVAKLKGGGAAGGLGAGLVAFARARMKRGVDLVIEATQLKRYLQRCGSGHYRRGAGRFSDRVRQDAGRSREGGQAIQGARGGHRRGACGRCSGGLFPRH